MKYFVLAIILATTGTAYADSDAANQSIKNATCLMLGQLAEGVMTARQSGKPISTVLGTLDGGSSDIDNLARTIIIEAYEEPRWNGSEYQSRAITEFENSVMVRCYKTL